MPDMSLMSSLGPKNRKKTKAVSMTRIIEKRKKSMRDM
jgi:hypothetical protein